MGGIVSRKKTGDENTKAVEEEKQQEVNNVEASPRKEPVVRTALEQRVIDTLKQKHQDGLTKGVMNKVLLNFPNIQKTFTDLRALYEEIDADNSDSLELGEVKTLMEKLNTGLSDTTIQELFKEANVGDDGHINFREFLTCLGIGFLLNLIPLPSEALETVGDDTPALFHGATVRKAFDMATEMYLVFDVSESGLITFSDMVNAISGGDSSEATKSMKAHQNQNPVNENSTSPMVELLSKDRWKELDSDSDGTITYSEFIYTFVKWVSSMSTDEDDESPRNPN